MAGAATLFEIDVESRKHVDFRVETRSTLAIDRVQDMDVG